MALLEGTTLVSLLFVLTTTSAQPAVFPQHSPFSARTPLIAFESTFQRGEAPIVSFLTSVLRPR